MLKRRVELERAARSLGFDCDLAERVPAHSRPVEQVLAAEIAHCDSYLGVFGWSQGTLAGPNKLPITALEFLEARNRGLRHLVFVQADPDHRREPVLQRFLEEHVLDPAKGVYSVPYRDDADLLAKAMQAIAELRPELVVAIEPDGTAHLFVEGLRPAVTVADAALQPFRVTDALAPAMAAIRDLLLRDQANRARLPDESLLLLGEAMGELLPQAARALLDQVLDRHGEMQRPLVLRIRTRDHALLALPWELLSTHRHPFPVRAGHLEIVRELPRQGTEMQVAGESMASAPVPHLSILGFTAAPIDDEQSQVGMGATRMRDDASLFWEREQEQLLAALHPLLVGGRAALDLPDEGSAELLRSKLAEKERPGLLHLSCHGGAHEAKPAEFVQALYLEDDDGRRRPLPTDELLGWLKASSAPLPQLIVLSACYTAAESGARGEGRGGGETTATAARAAPVVRSMAEELVLDGVPRVLAMQSSISDHGATQMAGAFYARLAEGADLPLALRTARLRLCAEGATHEWAIPVFFQQGGAAGTFVIAPDAQTTVTTPLAVTRSLYDTQGVTYLDRGYIGRRDFERDLLHAWRAGSRLLVIHGLGGIGKSTMAARFLERRASEGVRVVILKPGRKEGAALLDEVASDAAVGVKRPDPAVAGEDTEARFRELLQAELRRQPTVIYFDNFEDNQDEGTGALRGSGASDPGEATEGGGKAIDLATALTLLARLGGEKCCLLFTSRVAFELPPDRTPYPTCCLDLGELSPSGIRKFRLTQPPLAKLPDATWKRLVGALGGHPKALELLSRQIVAHQPRLATFLSDLDRVVARVGENLAASQDRGRALLLDHVVRTIPAERLPALDRLALLTAPLPTAELAELLRADGVASAADDLEWLRQHGLLARTVSPRGVVGEDWLHRLIAYQRRHALPPEARRAFHQKAAAHLLGRKGPLSDYGLAAGHHVQAGDSVSALNCYLRWSLQLRESFAYRASAEVADVGGANVPATTPRAKLERARLWYIAYDAVETLGCIDEAKELLRRAESDAALAPADADKTTHSFVLGSLALRQSHHAKGPTEREALLRVALSRFQVSGHERDGAIALGQIADILQSRGQLDEALRILRDEVLNAFERLGDVRERAVVMDKIAEILQSRGQLDEALRIRREEVLTAFERLGDVRSRAVTMGRIADILQSRGQLDEALGIRRQEQLPVYERLGDVRSRAVTMGKIADIFQNRRQLDEALRIRKEEELPVYERLGDVRERAVTMGKIADILQIRGQLDEALRIRKENELPVYEQLGDVRARALTMGKIADILQSRGQLDEALRIRKDEELPIYKRLGDVRSRALAVGKIADIAAAKGDLRSALELTREKLEVVRQLQDLDSIAHAQFQIAQFELQSGRAEVAFEPLVESFRLNMKLQRPDGIAAVGWLLAQFLVAMKHPEARQVIGDTRAAAQVAQRMDLIPALDELARRLPPEGAAPAS